MKKVFISMPMKGRTKEQIEKSIEKTKDVVRAYLDEDVDFINTIVEENPPYNKNNEAVWYLGKSIQILSQCDMLVVPNTYEYKGCNIERKVAGGYGISVMETDVKYICPDVYEKSYEECCATVNQI